jgi:hypothetical protein
MSNNLRKQKINRPPKRELLFDVRIRSYDNNDGGDQMETTVHYEEQNICPLCQLGVFTTVLAGMILESEEREGIKKGDLLKSVIEEISGKHHDMENYIPKDHAHNLN